MASEVLAANWLKQEVRSESTLPLLNFLLSCKGPDESPKSLARNLHYTSASVGEKEAPIPDESEELKEVLLQLIKDGPGKVTGDPTVSY